MAKRYNFDKELDAYEREKRQLEYEDREFDIYQDDIQKTGSDIDAYLDKHPTAEFHDDE